jgi:hypothetical protein
MSEAWSEAMPPTTCSGLDENFPAVSTIGAFLHLACYYFMHHTEFIAASWVGERCSAYVEAWSVGLGVPTEPRKLGSPWPNITIPFSHAARMEHAAARNISRPL